MNACRTLDADMQDCFGHSRIGTAWRAVALCFMPLICTGVSANELLRCRTIVAPADRLACYDKLSPSALSSTQTVSSGGVAEASSAGTAPAALPAALSPSRPSPGGVVRPESTFGQPDRTAVAERDAIESTIFGAFEGWRPGHRFTLANGQVWQIADESEGAYSRRDVRVRVERGRIGGYFLFVEGIAQTPRVRRLK